MLSSPGEKNSVLIFWIFSILFSILFIFPTHFGTRIFLVILTLYVYLWRNNPFMRWFPYRYFCTFLSTVCRLLQVWGCGGVEAAESQRRLREWEKMEAFRRRKVCTCILPWMYNAYSSMKFLLSHLLDQQGWDQEKLGGEPWSLPARLGGCDHGTPQGATTGVKNFAADFFWRMVQNWEAGYLILNHIKMGVILLLYVYTHLIIIWGLVLEQARY